MKRKFRDAWIAALESGEFTQGRGALMYTTNNNQKKFCCLGVLTCVLIRLGEPLMINTKHDTVLRTDQPEPTEVRLGNSDYMRLKPYIGSNTITDFTIRNDGHVVSRPWSFAQIARCLNSLPAIAV